MLIKHLAVDYKTTFFYVLKNPKCQSNNDKMPGHTISYVMGGCNVVRAWSNLGQDSYAE